MTERFVRFVSKAGATKYYTGCALLYEFKLISLMNGTNSLRFSWSSGHKNEMLFIGVRYLKVEVDEQDTQSKDNAVTEMYITVLERFNIALRKASVENVICPFIMYFDRNYIVFIHISPVVVRLV